MKPFNKKYGFTGCLIFITSCIVSFPCFGQQTQPVTIVHDNEYLQVYPGDYKDKVLWGPENDASGSTDIRNGKANTGKIIDKYGNWNEGRYAAMVCDELNAFGHSDWYLPARAELHAIYKSRHRIGKFSQDYYWSSTDESWGTEAQVFDFSSGMFLFRNKNNTAKVRCIRRTGVSRKVDSSRGHYGGSPRWEIERTGTFMDPRDGKSYSWEKIGHQVWMAENLAYRPNTGNYWAYENDRRNVYQHGYLYDHKTALNACPDGWNLPGLNDWVNVFNVKGFNGSDLLSSTGLIMDEITENIIGLDGQMGGYRNPDGSFHEIGSFSTWWSNDKNFSLSHIMSKFNQRQLQPGIEQMENLADYGFSVRCVKDQDIEFEIKVLDENGRPAPDVQVEFNNVTKKFCHWGITDQYGMVSFNVERMPEIIILRGLPDEEKYGVTSLIPNQNTLYYNVTIPNYPRNKKMIREQVDHLVDLISEAFNIYSIADFVKNAWPHVEAIGYSKIQLGVPTVFSINLIPKKNERGETVFELNGRLVDDMARMLGDINPYYRGTLSGRNVHYDMSQSY